MTASNVSRQDLGVALCPYNKTVCSSGLSLTNASGDGMNNTATQYYGSSIALPNVAAGGSCWYAAYSQCSNLNLSAQSSNPNFKVTVLMTESISAANTSNPFANLTTASKDASCGNASIHIFATTSDTTVSTSRRMLFANTEGFVNLQAPPQKSIFEMVQEGIEKIPSFLGLNL